MISPLPTALLSDFNKSRSPPRLCDTCSQNQAGQTHHSACSVSSSKPWICPFRAPPNHHWLKSSLSGRQGSFSNVVTLLICLSNILPNVVAGNGAFRNQASGLSFSVYSSSVVCPSVSLRLKLLMLFKSLVCLTQTPCLRCSASRLFLEPQYFGGAVFLITA